MFPNLTTLTAFLWDHCLGEFLGSTIDLLEDGSDLTEDDSDLPEDDSDLTPPTVSNALAMIDTHFRANASLQKIVFRIFDSDPAEEVKRNTKKHEWHIEVLSHSPGKNDCEVPEISYTPFG